MVAENYARAYSVTPADARETTGEAEESRACSLKYQVLFAGTIVAIELGQRSILLRHASLAFPPLLPIVILLAYYLNLQLIFGALQASPPEMAEILTVSSKSPLSGTSIGKQV